MVWETKIVSISKFPSTLIGWQDLFKELQDMIPDPRFVPTAKVTFYTDYFSFQYEREETPQEEARRLLATAEYQKKMDQKEYDHFLKLKLKFEAQDS